jgi:hypothetical protein
MEPTSGVGHPFASVSTPSHEVFPKKDYIYDAICGVARGQPSTEENTKQRSFAKIERGNTVGVSPFAPPTPSTPSRLHHDEEG